MRTTIAATLLVALVSSASAKPGEYRQVGSGGSWKDTVVAAVDGGKLYTIEKDGTFYVTELATGEWKKVGKTEFATTKALWAGGGKVICLEADGSLYVINPADASSTKLGKEGEWKRTTHGTLFDGALYTVESSGKLFVTDLATGTWKELGKGDYGNTKFMTATGDKLYTIESSGTVYAIGKDGTWAKVGKEGDYKRTVLATALGGKLYTVETTGQLFETDPATGTYVEVAKDYKSTRFLLADGANLYTIEKGGTLYAVDVK